MARQIQIVTGINARGLQFDTNIVQAAVEKAAAVFSGEMVTESLVRQMRCGDHKENGMALAVTIVTEREDFRQKALYVAQVLKDLFNQQKVLLTITEVDEVRFV